MPDKKKTHLSQLDDEKSGVTLMNSGASLVHGKDDDSSVGTFSSSSSMSGDENTERGNWTGRMDFLLSCVGYAVGLGNIWRFPYLCYRNGGGAFLIPYITFLLLCGMPLFFLEVSYGQFASLSPTAVWKLSPLFKGIGWGMVIISGIVCIYYNIIITWTLYYLVMSLRSVLPWASCGNEWNDDRCALRAHNGNETLLNQTAANETVMTYNTTFSVNGTEVSAVLTSVVANASELPKQTPSEQYWQNHVLELTSGIDDLGDIRWQLLVSLIVAWILVFLCLFKGVKSSGRVVYVTATFPYLVLIILLVRGVTLPGALNGIKFYLIPDFAKLGTFKVWAEAAAQIFYSVGAAWGALITMSSYNKFNNNCFRDALIVPAINCGTSIFAGFVIFSIVGFMAHETGQDIKDVVTQGPGLVFVVYPEALAKLPISPLWAVLFFLMLFTIGLDSQFGMFETMTSAFLDEFPKLLRKRKMLFTAVMCVVEFLIGIPLVMQGGIYILQIMDWYCATFSLMILSFLECMVIAWIYGVDRFYKDIELMIGYKPPIVYKYAWCYVTPLVIVFILIASLAMHTPVTYGDVVYPEWAVGLGWVMASISMVPVPIVMIVKILREEGSFVERVKKLVRPAPEWGPAVLSHRKRYLLTLPPAERSRMVKDLSTCSSLSTGINDEESNSGSSDCDRDEKSAIEMDCLMHESEIKLNV
ncbi:sodium- and chloride-dependent glycine transporter 1 [Lingula anatina]|uniref:Transporter n=1 Tax=Lingula anatina TaxID=7574 RepID=A0A1S3HKC4_LINAN|nr:sodium- and chloride-dependent glycine transporter 1 [Lingula anatina]|eukprot:XP_013385449.1 sodium- and chloride-dependent glycine transporter 1 [Lingula anatina]